MKAKNVSILRLIAVFLIIAAMVLTLACCGKKSDTKGNDAPKDTTVQTEEEKKDEISLTILVTGPDGKTDRNHIKTTADNLADALLENELVEGEETEYGLYITAVKGVVAEDGYWWAISKNGAMLETGASSTPIADGEQYELEYSKY